MAPSAGPADPLTVVDPAPTARRASIRRRDTEPDVASGRSIFRTSGVGPVLSGPAAVMAELRRTPLTMSVVALLLASNIVLHLDSVDVGAVVSWASTNVDNLSTHPIAAMFTSTFVVPGELFPELLFVAVGFAVLEQAIGVRRALVVAVAGQVVPTLITEYGAALASHWNLIVSSAVDRSDVGVSYVMYAVLAAAVLQLRDPSRVVGWLAVAATVVAPAVEDPGMTSAGHMLSVLVGTGTVLLLRRFGSARNGLRSRHVRGD